MRLVSICCVLVFLYLNPIFAMDEEVMPQAQKSWRLQIKLLSENYQRYPPSQYACICTRFLHRTLSSEIARDEQKKNLLLTQLLIALEDDENSAEEISDRVAEMAPYIDHYGDTYFESACTILKPLVSKPKKCAICFERASTILLKPCGHHVMCRQCLDDLNDSAEALKCPICVQAVQETIAIDVHFFICRSCKEAAPEILFIDCGHIAACESCAEVGVCPVCQRTGSERKKVFF